MKLCMILLIALMTPPLPAPQTYVIPGASIIADVDCTVESGFVTYHLTTTDAGMGAYQLPGLAEYPRVSLLSTVPDQATLAGETLSWKAHATADEVWIIAGRRSECLPSAPQAVSVGRTWLPLVLR